MADSLASDMVVAAVATTVAVASADIAAAAWVLNGGATETGLAGVIATTFVVRLADTEAVGTIASSASVAATVRGSSFSFAAEATEALVAERTIGAIAAGSDSSTAAAPMALIVATGGADFGNCLKEAAGRGWCRMQHPVAVEDRYGAVRLYSSVFRLADAAALVVGQTGLLKRVELGQNLWLDPSRFHSL